MAAPEEILSILEDLVNAYPGNKLSRAKFQIYVDHLSDIHPVLLQRAVNNLISQSTWFPRVSEIRAEAAKIVGLRNVSTWQPPQNYLWARYRQLEHQFYHHRILDPDNWIHLAENFDRCNQLYSAEIARSRLAIFQQLLNDEQITNNESAY